MLNLIIIYFVRCVTLFSQFSPALHLMNTAIAEVLFLPTFNQDRTRHNLNFYDRIRYHQMGISDPLILATIPILILTPIFELSQGQLSQVEEAS